MTLAPCAAFALALGICLWADNVALLLLIAAVAAVALNPW